MINRLLLCLILASVAACSKSPTTEESQKNASMDQYLEGHHRTHVRTLEEIAADNKRNEEATKAKDAP
jgi:hypothetical protein